MGGYPTGPPTCGGPEDPTCKVLIPDMTHGGPIAVFCFWGLFLLATSIFQVYKAWHRKKHPTHPLVMAANSETSTMTYVDQGAVQSIVEVNQQQPILQFTAYRTAFFGEVCWWLCILMSVQWICIYIVVLLDTYDKCQLNSIDNTCFYGTYFIFGSYDRNGTVFFSLWCMSVIWFTTLVLNKREIHNWFRMPCGLSIANVVHVWAQDQDEVLSVNVTALVNIVRKVKDNLRRSEQRGHAETIAISKTSCGTRHFLFQGQRYLVERDALRPAQFQVGTKYAEFYQASEGLSTKDAGTRFDELGPNEVPFKPESIWVSVAEEMFTMFRVYQFLIYAIWLWYAYIFVGALLLVIVFVAAAITIVNRRRGQYAIAKLTKYESMVEVKRDGTWSNLDFRLLVPGDLVKVKSNWHLPCDLLIKQGECVCNESNLTGEAMPVQKYKAPNNDSVYEPEGLRGVRHTLFSGTEVLQAGAGGSTEVLAIVTATGMSTSKGKLLSTILFPEQMVFKYDEELPIVMLLLLSYAAVCFALSLVFQYHTGQISNWITKWTYCIAIVSQVVSPLLPVALEIGQIYASRRLQKRGIFCLNSKRIAIAGKIRVFCFDKTGTLTNSGLDFIGVQDVRKDKENHPTFGSVQSPLSHDKSIDNVILHGLATCHAVSKFGEHFVGNEVEVKMFSATGWDLGNVASTALQQYPTVLNKSGDVHTIVRRNGFEHARATMSVVMQNSTGELHVYCKGSFEKIQEKSMVESLPSSYLETARNHALDGCYVLGLSHKNLGTDVSLDTIKSLSRDDLESNLTFISLLLFRNELKPDTCSAIENLREGKVRSLMVTGDNAQCGFYIAKKCSMIAPHVQVLLADIGHGGSVTWQPMVTTVTGNTQALPTTDMVKTHQKGLEGGLTELAVTGKAFNELCKMGRMKELLFYTRIFSRFTPEDKVKVVNMHRDCGLVVGMCGDGGNDCGALRSAHAGLALSEAEASVVSPFTSKAKTVSSVVELLREGRAALHTSFACFKFLIIYGLSFSMLKLASNWYGVIACQMDYFFIDGVAVLSLGYSMNLSNPQKKLRKEHLQEIQKKLMERPTSSLFGPVNVASVLGMWVINLCFTLSALSFMSSQPEYIKWPAKYSQGKSWWTLGDNWEATVIFFTIYCQFITSAFVFTIGSSFRRAACRNYLLLVSWTGIFTLISVVLLLPPSSFTHTWHVASEEFNRPNSSSDVWAAYQAHGGAPSPGMPFLFRLKLWFIIIANMIIIALWQKVVVEGPVATFLRQRFPSSTPKFLL